MATIRFFAQATARSRFEVAEELTMKEAMEAMNEEN